MIDDTNITFDPNKKLKTIILDEGGGRVGEPKPETETVQNSEMKEEFEEYLGEKQEKTLKISTFNNLPLKSQRIFINNQISEIEENEMQFFLSNIKKVLEYFYEKDIETEQQYFSIICEDENATIEKSQQFSSNISISWKAIEHIKSKEQNQQKEFFENLNSFENVVIEVKYPSESFENIYKMILNFQEKHENIIQINIYIDDLKNTDMRFRNNIHISSILIGNSINKIIGEEVGFFKTGGGSFCGCSSLTQITIPSSITEIGPYAFCICSSLAQITIPSSVTDIGNGAFSGCSSLTQIKLPSSIKSIKFNTFYHCSSLKQITIPSHVTEIGEYAFCGCSLLTQITIPSSVTKIDNFAFSDCPSLTQISILSPNVEFGTSVFNNCKVITLSNDMTTIFPKMFNNCKELKQITIPSSVTKIRYLAFVECSSLKSITIPSSVTSIEMHAFFQCSSLSQITIPSSVTEIKDFAFSGCSSSDFFLNRHYDPKFLEQYI